MTNKTRGRILRDTNAGPGLLSVNNQQLPFTLESHWKSPVATAANMLVDVELDASGQITSVTAVDPAQVAREQAELALQVAKERGGQALAMGGQMLGGLSGVVGVPRLVLTGLLCIGWYVLAVLKLKIFSSLTQAFTFWDLIPALHSPTSFAMGMQGGGGGSRGILGLLMIAATLAPLLPGVWKKPIAQLGALAPLLWMVLVGVYAVFSVRNGMSDAGGSDNPFVQAAAKEMMKQLMHAISLGLGFYLSLLVSVALAATGLIAWRAAERATTHPSF